MNNILTVLFLTVMLCMLFFLTACGSSGPKVNGPIADVTKPAQEIGEISQEVTTSSDKIVSEIEETKKVTPEEIKPQIEPHLEVIKDEAARIKDKAEDLGDIQKDLKTEQEKIGGMVKQLSSLEGDKSKLRKEIDDLKSKNNQLLKTILAWLAAACVAGIGLCVFVLILTQNKTAIFGIVAFAATLGTAIAVSAFVLWIAYIAAGVFIAVCFVVGIWLWKAIGKKKTEVKTANEQNKVVTKALEEVVQTSELAKNYLPEDARIHIFGHGPDPGKANLIQSDETIKIVRDIRNSDKVKTAAALTPASGEPYMTAPRVPARQG